MSENVRDPAPLTLRQAEVARYVAAGRTDREIAEAIGCSPETVKAHVRDAAHRLPGEGRPRFKVMLWFLNLRDEP